ncbi:hypothetical protein [Arthrobacter sp. NPDC090010]|uniref:hypothetical protein n=1 Tax=Arthrobacter sp. NPDC090010 TaxID=3363942 RepID=UPI003815E1A3
MAKKNGRNSGFVKQVLNSKAVQDLVLAKAKEVARAAGGESMGFKVTDLVLEDTRSAASVMALGHAANHNRKHHSLIRAMDAARD